MAKRVVLIVSLLAAALIISCNSTNENKMGDNLSTMLQNDEFNNIQESAQGSTVRFYMWGGDAKINQWVDSFVVENLKNKYGITLKRIAMDASQFVSKLSDEKISGKSTGVIDLVWINGENFKRAREEALLFGPFAEKLPNFKYVNPESAVSDFGYPVEGYEAPYGKAQFVLEYDSAVTKKPPRTLESLETWIINNPGSFTYPQPPDFTGSAFIRQLFYMVSGDHQQYLDGFDAELYEANSRKLWNFLKRVKPHLWSGGASYPRGKGALDRLFQSGEILMGMSYHQAAAAGLVADGRYPSSVRTVTLKNASVFNIHFTAIPFNAPNKAGALVTANFLLSPEAQLSKNDPANWGDFTVLDTGKIPPEWQTKFADLELGEATLPITELQKDAVPEIPSEYVERLEDDWETFVLYE